MAQEEPKPINEWLFDEYIRVKDALKDLAERHEIVVNNYAAVCRQNDKMRDIGDDMRDLLDECSDTMQGDLPAELFDMCEKIEKAIQEWGDAQI